eukprot:1957044-Prymnesium_polylepis.1
MGLALNDLGSDFCIRERSPPAIPGRRERDRRRGRSFQGCLSVRVQRAHAACTEGGAASMLREVPCLGRCHV